MHTINNPGSIQHFIEEIAEKNFVNEDVSKFAFTNLSPKEKKEISTQAAIYEYAAMPVESTESLINEADEAKVGNGYKSANAFNSVYFAKVAASKGDITKTPNYAAGQTLIKHAIKANANVGSMTPNMVFFNKKITIVEDASKYLLQYRQQFVEAIKMEQNEYSEEGRRVISQYYTNMVVQLDLCIDVLYSSSIKAKINYATKPAFVQDVYFECGDDLLSDALTNLHYFNALGVSGKLRNVLNKKNIEDLVMAKDRLLTKNENVLDVAFGIITQNSVLDLLLLPIYALRYSVYAVKYLVASYNRMAFGFDTSLEMIRKERVSESEFNAYKSTSERKATAVNQASMKASADVSREIGNHQPSFSPSSAGAGVIM